MDFSVKDVPPPVPLKTYQWEDLKRDKERGKYPYTYLYKNLLMEQDNMAEDDKQSLVSAEGENPADEGQKKPKSEQVKTKIVVRRKEDIRTTKQESEHSEKKEEKTISDENERITTRQVSMDDIEIKYELLVEDESLDKTDRGSVISKADSKNTESEDTYTERNIEQGIDKEEIPKSVLDTNGLEAITSVSTADFVHDSKLDVTSSVSETPTALEVPQDHKSGSSEGNKSNLNLFEKIKNSKFKPPTFAIPQFKKLTFHKNGSKRVKHDAKEQKLTVTEVKKSEVTLQRRTCESPVYIYIPLNPTAQDLEKERQEAMKSESHRRLTDTADSRIDRLNDSKDTNGTVSRATTSRNVDVQSTSSKWKRLQIKTDKKSPPFKKKCKDTNAKETSLKTEKETTLPVTKKRDDCPVEYIYIPLKPPENETRHTPSSEKLFDEVDQVEALNTKLISIQTEVSVVTKNDEITVDKSVVKEEEEIITESKKSQKPEIEIKQLPNVSSKPDEDKCKGAIKKKRDDKGNKVKDKTTKLTKDIKTFVSKLKGEQTKTKCGGSSLKTASAEKESSPTSNKQGDSPVEYIYIPLKGPLPDENSAIIEVKSSEAENISTKAKIQEVTVAIVEKEKPSLMTKFQGAKTEQKSPPAIKKGIKQINDVKVSPRSSEEENVNKKSSPLLSSVKRSDSPVEYIYIPLKPLESGVSEALAKRTDDKAEGTLKELQVSKQDSKLELEQKPTEALIKKIKSTVTELEKVSKKPKESEKDNIMTRLKGLKPKKAQKAKPDVKVNKEQVIEKIMPVQNSDAPVEYIYIPLKPPASERAESNTEEIINTEESWKIVTAGSTTLSTSVAQSSSLPLEEPKRRKIEDNTEEARLIKEAVIKRWQGFKTKPLQKPMPLKRTEPKMTSPKMEKKSISVGCGDSPVEYIYIPLKPTEEQLEYERRMKEQQQKRSAAPRASAAARKPECSVVAEHKCKTGAIKKQPIEKGNKRIKDTTTKLTKDIKKFASKLKDMQKKSKKPTFKTFKHGSISISKNMSPTTSKRPVDNRPVSTQHEDSPVEYIFIPLKGPETTEEPVKETEKDIQAATAAINMPSEIIEKIEDLIKKPSTSDGPHYELLTKEDEEDGLKTAIIASLNEMKPSEEVLKAEDFLKLNRKLSIESIKMETMENGLENGDENVVYEKTNQRKDEIPDTSVSTARKLVTVPKMTVDGQMIKDTSLEDDHNKWSKSTLLAVC